MKHVIKDGKYFTKVMMIWVTFQLEGLHRWAAAPNEVDYLQSVHRHMFHFKVEMEVFHDDREVEFHMLKNFLLDMMGSHFSLVMNKEVAELGGGESCEMIANTVKDILHREYGAHRFLNIQVSEDGECGVSLQVAPEEKESFIDSVLR